MKRLFSVLTIGLLLSLPVSAQNVVGRLTKAESEKLISAEVVNKATSTSDNYRSVISKERKIRNANLSLSKAPSVDYKGKKITFTGMLQYNLREDGLMALQYGFYKFGSEDGFKRHKMADVNYCLNGGGVYYNHKLHGASSIPLPYVSSDSNWKIAEFDEDTWEPTENNGIPGGQDFVMRAGYDPVTKMCYGYTNGSTSVFYKFDYETQTRNMISQVSERVACMTIDNYGNGYALTEEGAFCSVNLETGKLTTIDYVDFDFACALQSMCFDPRDNKLYLCASEISPDEEEMWGRLCEVDVETAKTTLIAYFPEDEEYTALHVLVEPEQLAPAAITDLAVDFNGTTTGTCTFTIPTKTVGGSSLSGNVKYTITVNDDDEHPVTGSAQAGAKVSQSITADKEGKTKVVVVLNANNEDGQRNWIINYAGLENASVQNLQFTYDATTHQTNVTWEQNGTGQYGGKADISGISYNVYRYPEKVKVASKTNALSFTETLSECPFATYYYMVETVAADGSVLSATESNKSQIGDGYDIPYAENFTDYNSTSGKFTMLDNNADGTTWVINELLGGVLSIDNIAVDPQADDWALMPPLHLTAGMSYDLAFNARCVRNAWPETVSVAFGQGTDVASYTELIPSTQITNSIQNAKFYTATLHVKETGDYRIGFHCTSPRLSNSLFIDDISVVAGTELVTPDSVKNIKLTPDAEGDLAVNIEFDAPSLSIGGEALTSLSKVVITRGDDDAAVATITDVQPGKHCTYLDEDAYNGTLTYKFVAYNEAGAGREATASVYVGYDAPSSPRNITINDNLDGSALLSWTSPDVIGKNGGYVDLDDVAYQVYEVNTDGTTKKIKENIKSADYTVTGMAQVGAQYVRFFGVSAENEIGESDVAYSDPIIGGAPYTLPFSEGFNYASFNKIWTTKQSGSGSFGLASGFSTDGDNWVAAFMPSEVPAWAKISSGKIDISHAESPRLVFSTVVKGGTDNNLQVFLRKNGASTENLIYTVESKNYDNENEMVNTYVVDLAEYKDSKYVTITFRANVSDNNYKMALLDDVQVLDVKSDDVESGISVPSRVMRGQTSHITATVHNIGMNDASDYEVSLYVNDRKVKTVNGEKITPFARKDYAFDYTIQAIDKENTVIWAEVEYAADKNTDNNASEHKSTLVAETWLTTVDDLAATTSGNEAIVIWSKPNVQTSVVDSFEGYPAFTSTFGEWTTYDGDEQPTVGINGIYWPTKNQPASFQVFNFEDAGVNLAEYPAFAGNTGKQFLACFRPLSASVQNDDWLISPELSGEAQTVSFYVKGIAGSYADRYEVYYSTSDAESLVGKVAEGTSTSEFKKVSVDLPEGTKYFAVHCCSNGGGIFMIDDIAYESVEPKILGYNIYRDDVKVGSVDADAEEFTENVSGLEDGRHYYYLSVVYDKGESGLSNKALVVTNGINDINADEMLNSEIFTPAGIKVGRGKNMKQLPRGLYIINGHKVINK